MVAEAGGKMAHCAGLDIFSSRIPASDQSVWGPWPGRGDIVSRFIGTFFVRNNGPGGGRETGGSGEMCWKGAGAADRRWGPRWRRPAGGTGSGPEPPAPNRVRWIRVYHVSRVVSRGRLWDTVWEKRSRIWDTRRLTAAAAAGWWVLWPAPDGARCHRGPLGLRRG